MSIHRLRYYILGIGIIFLNTTVAAQNYIAVDKSSVIKFSIRNFAINVNGTFTGLQGTLRFNPSDLSGSVFNVSVDANSVNTGMNARDNHLRKEEYFNVEKYPTLNFVSKQITAGEIPGTYLLSGTLTIKGVNKQVSMLFTAVPQKDGFIFSGQYKLNRKDFKVGGSNFVLSDNVLVSLLVFAKKI